MKNKDEILVIQLSEGGDIMFLPSVGIYRRAYTAPKTRKTTSSFSPL
jgi:hypothetical protein